MNETPHNKDEPPKKERRIPIVSTVLDDGTMVVVGLPEKDIPLGAFSLTSRRRSIAGSQIGGIREIQEMLDFCSQHKIVCDIEMIPIQKIDEAYERMLKGDVKYRFVIDMKTLKV